MIKIGGLLQAKMYEKDIKQKELADMMGLDQRTISNYCNDINFPNIDTLSKLCKILDLDVNALLEIEHNGNLSLLVKDDLEIKLLDTFRKIPKQKRKEFVKSISMMTSLIDSK